jgi:hypothetical protein
LRLLLSPLKEFQSCLESARDLTAERTALSKVDSKEVGIEHAPDSFVTILQHSEPEKTGAQRFDGKDDFKKEACAFRASHVEVIHQNRPLPEHISPFNSHLALLGRPLTTQASHSASVPAASIYK